MVNEIIICGIYKITNPNGKIYIGLSTNILERKKSYMYSKCKLQLKIYRSIKKYGWENHLFEIIHTCLPNELNNLEIYYEQLYDSSNPKTGLNIKHCGGSKGKASSSMKQKESESQKKAWARIKSSPEYNSPQQIQRRKDVGNKILIARRKSGNDKWSLESRAKIRAANKGKSPPNKGKKGQIAWNKGLKGTYTMLASRGKKRTKEVKDKMSIKKLGNKNAVGLRTDEQKINIRLGIAKYKQSEEYKSEDQKKIRSDRIKKGWGTRIEKEKYLMLNT